jgi:ATP-dependent DNA helicase RecG
MTTTEERRQTALEAIGAVVAGTLAADAETEMVDFKTEEGAISRAGEIVAIGPRHEPAAVALAADAACMANTTRGGVLVVGVVDKQAGPQAFTGANSDPDWLRRRIWALTKPNLTVDIEEMVEHGSRLLLINVPDALEEVRSGDRLRTRVGTNCEELSGDRARQFLEARRGYDWSAQPSGLRLSAAQETALLSARRHYEAEHGTAPGSNRDLVRRLGVLLGDDDADPEMTCAGALLLCAFDPQTPRLRLLVTDAEGVAARRSTEPLAAPLLPAFDQIMAMLLDEVFPAERKVVGVQRQAVRAIPEVVFREALVNAIMHRDYRLDRAIIIALAVGDPPDVLKVRSPGGLPPGIAVDRLIAAPSRPRNPVLAEAMRVLGLAEKEGVGIDTMYRLMLEDGHPSPEISEQDGEVVVRLSGGRPDAAVREFFDGMATRQPALAQDVRVAIAITLLFTRSVLRPEGLAHAAQSTVGDALDTLTHLADAGAVEQLLDRSLSYRLTGGARSALASRIRYRTPAAIETHAEIILAYLDAHADIGAVEATALLGVQRVRASEVLRELVNRGQLTPTRGRHRGPGIRYRRP